MFGVIGELVNYVIHISKKKLKKKNFSLGVQTIMTNFWSQGILGDNPM